jgi:hypothetical protein
MPWYPGQYLPQLRDAVNRAPSIFNRRPWELELAAGDRAERRGGRPARPGQTS